MSENDNRATALLTETRDLRSQMARRLVEVVRDHPTSVGALDDIDRAVLTEAGYVGLLDQAERTAARTARADMGERTREPYPTVNAHGYGSVLR